MSIKFTIPYFFLNNPYKRQEYQNKVAQLSIGFEIKSDSSEILGNYRIKRQIKASLRQTDKKGIKDIERILQERYGRAPERGNRTLQRIYKHAPLETQRLKKELKRVKMERC